MRSTISRNYKRSFLGLLDRFPSSCSTFATVLRIAVEVMAEWKLVVKRVVEEG